MLFVVLQIDGFLIGKNAVADGFGVSNEVVRVDQIVAVFVRETAAHEEIQEPPVESREVFKAVEPADVRVIVNWASALLGRHLRMVIRLIGIWVVSSVRGCVIIKCCVQVCFPSGAVA